MNTKIGTTFGLALLVAIAAIATMFALGMFSASEVRADHEAGHTLPGQVADVDFKPASSSVNSKTSWDVTFGVSAALVKGSGTITITFPDGVVIPATIDKSRISAGAGVGLDPLTSDPTVSGQTVTLTVPATNASGTNPTDPIDINDIVTVSFSQLAGIVNPAKSGTAGTTAAGTAGKVKTSAQATNANIESVESFNRTISLGGATSVAEGGTVTVTIGGFTPDLAVSLSGSVSGSAVIGSDRKAVITGTMKGTGGTVTATDTSGLAATSTVSLTVKASITVTATAKAGDTITLTGKNFTDAGNIASVADILFAGSAIKSGLASAGLGNVVTALPFTLTNRDAVTPNDVDDFLIKITVPSTTKKGINQIKVTDNSGKSATVTIDIEGRSVTITPTSGPPGTVVTITGAGFPASRTTNILNTSSIVPAFSSSTKTGLFTTGTGALPGSDQFTIPSDATTSVITLTVSIRGSDAENATGTAKFTVTSRVLAVTPTSGPRGTKVLITGTKFTGSGAVAANSITVDSVSTTHSLANLTSSGDVPGISLSIPSGAGIGEKTISLTDNGADGIVNNSDDLTGTTKFTITVPTISVVATSATMGEDVQVTGGGWVPASSVTITLASGGTTVATKVATADAAGAIDVLVTIPSTVGVGPKTVTFTAADASTFGNTATAQTLSIPKATVTLSVAEAEIGEVVVVEATGFTPSSGLSVLTIGGADVRSGVVTSDTRGSLSTSFVTPGLTGSNIVTVTIGATTVSTSLTVKAATTPAPAATDTTQVIFADLIANDDNLVRVWRFNNADQSWQFFDPRPAFEQANTLLKSGGGDIVWVNVTTDQEFQGDTLVSGWNLIVLN